MNMRSNENLRALRAAFHGIPGSANSTRLRTCRQGVRTGIGAHKTKVAPNSEYQKPKQSPEGFQTWTRHSAVEWQFYLKSLFLFFIFWSQGITL